MNSNKIWSFLIHLSNHMWDDENTPPNGWYVNGAYTENNNVSIKAWDAMVDFLSEHKYNMLLIDVGDGIKFESRPEISAPDAWDKDFLKKKLDEARSKGLEVIPKLNFSCTHDTWLKKYRRMVGTPEYYAACADVIRETCEVFDNPRFIHLGMDEEQQAAATVTRLEAYVMRGEKLWWNDMFFYFREAEKYGATPWVWSDYYWNHSESFLKNMPKSAIQSNWFYQRFKTYYPADNIANKRINTYEELDKNGFKQIPCVSQCRGYDGARANSVQTMIHCKTHVNEDNLLGFMMAPWAYTNDDEVYYNKDGAIKFYRARETAYPETL